MFAGEVYGRALGGQSGKAVRKLIMRLEQADAVGGDMHMLLMDVPTAMPRNT